ncbi:hypothetical protein SPV1_04238 [Mariprofundus ferrooxydans PV-1]|uniref:Uncharacterized protein n=1 Tax=Mariprofundus ferrooxydans PV-1 TaxID=314345 RepID=Q0F3E3_9PROT|nr:hypothetical protein SPV1_04238 [Mariprofundus ferrooxydans PV-1]
MTWAALTMLTKDFPSACLGVNYSVNTFTHKLTQMEIDDDGEDEIDE